jgi:hypothetical protein
MCTSDFIKCLREELPPVFTRKFISQKLGGYLSPGTLANLDCQGQGAGGIRAGKVVLYEKKAFLIWLEKRIRGGVSDE